MPLLRCNVGKENELNVSWSRLLKLDPMQSSWFTGRQCFVLLMSSTVDIHIISELRLHWNVNEKTISGDKNDNLNFDVTMKATKVNVFKLRNWVKSVYFVIHHLQCKRLTTTKCLRHQTPFASDSIDYRRKCQVRSSLRLGRFRWGHLPATTKYNNSIQ